MKIDWNDGTNDPQWWGLGIMSDEEWEGKLEAFMKGLNR